MLNKLLLILSAVALAGGSFLAFKNRKAFIETRNEKIEINSGQIKPVLTKIEAEIENINKEVALRKDAVRSKSEKDIALSNAQSNINAKTGDLTKITKDIEDKQAELAKIEADLAAVLGTDTIDTITTKIEQQQQEISNLQSEAENAETEYEIAQKKAASQEATVAALQRAASQRNTGINLNSLEGTVVATNQDYGFAVINVGSSRGVTGGSKLIVKRGDQRIGTLNITSVSPNRTIADIEAGSLAPGVSVSPGDKVIFEKVQR